MKQLLAVAIALFALPAAAQVQDLLSEPLPPANPQLEGQVQGQFAPMTTPPPGGAIQSVWDDADPADAVLWVRDPIKALTKVRLREGMTTTFYLPPSDELLEFSLGDSVNFRAQKCQADPGCIHVWPVAAGYDTSLTLVGKGRQGYSFYMRSDSVKSGYMPHIKVMIAPNGPEITPTADPQKISGDGSKDLPLAAPMDATKAPEWVRDDKFDPTSIRFDLEMSGDGEIAPVQVWRDKHFTWLDYAGQLQPKDWPGVWRVVDGIEEPVRIRKTKDNRFLIVETTDTLTLRRGEKVVCVKPRQDA